MSCTSTSRADRSRGNDNRQRPETAGPVPVLVGTTLFLMRDGVYYDRDLILRMGRPAEVVLDTEQYRPEQQRQLVTMLFHQTTPQIVEEAVEV